MNKTNDKIIKLISSLNEAIKKEVARDIPDIEFLECVSHDIRMIDILCRSIRHNRETKSSDDLKEEYQELIKLRGDFSWVKGMHEFIRK